MVRTRVRLINATKLVREIPELLRLSLTLAYVELPFYDKHKTVTVSNYECSWESS